MFFPLSLDSEVDKSRSVYCRLDQNSTYAQTHELIVIYFNCKFAVGSTFNLQTFS
jgi:hypothetical protein